MKQTERLAVSSPAPLSRISSLSNRMQRNLKGGGGAGGACGSEFGAQPLQPPTSSPSTLQLLHPPSSSPPSSAPFLSRLEGLEGPESWRASTFGLLSVWLQPDPAPPAPPPLSSSSPLSTSLQTEREANLKLELWGLEEPAAAPVQPLQPPQHLHQNKKRGSEESLIRNSGQFGCWAKKLQCVHRSGLGIWGFGRCRGFRDYCLGI